LAVDADQQQSFSLFLEVRGEQPPLQAFGEDLLDKLRPLIKQYDDVLIDCGGRDSAAQRAALVLADVALIPVTPRTTDRWTLNTVYELLDKAHALNPKLRAYFFFSRTDHRGLNGSAVVEARDYLRPNNDWCTLAEVPVANRVVYDKAMAWGKSVLDYEPADVKAVTETEVLFTHIQQAR
jgi:chromosome partitioning protein